MLRQIQFNNDDQKCLFKQEVILTALMFIKDMAIFTQYKF